MSATKKALKEIAYILQATVCAVSALEKACLSDSEVITNRQLIRLRRSAKEDVKARFDRLESLIRSLPNR
jgi:transcriptional regulator